MRGKHQLAALTALTVAVLLLIAVRPAQAQTETVLYNFNWVGGETPESSLTSHDGNFYGTTFSGGVGYGTVFELSPNGSGGWNETVLYTFCCGYGGADGAYPISNVIFDGLGNLYGTTEQGGVSGGTVFELSPVGSSWTETVLHSFDGIDGAYPVNNLIMDKAGNLFGATQLGGLTYGTVFELSPSGGGWTEQVIYNLDNYYGGYPR